jgi:hypothetical protein
VNDLVFNEGVSKFNSLIRGKKTTEILINTEFCMVGRGPVKLPDPKRWLTNPVVPATVRRLAPHS